MPSGVTLSASEEASPSACQLPSMPEVALPSGPPTELGEGVMEAGSHNATAFDPPLTFTLG